MESVRGFTGLDRVGYAGPSLLFARGLVWVVSGVKALFV